MTDHASEAAPAAPTRSLGIGEIQKLLPHRYPFLLVDRILSVQSRGRVVGIKNVTINEEFFLGHFPGNPVMPGVLIIEAMAQVGGCMLLADIPDPAEKLVYLVGLDKVRFRRPVVPGDQIVFTVDFLGVKQSLYRVRGEARVDGQLAAEAEILSSLRDRPKESA